uniref:Mvd1 C-terminal domain-containing protein n=1 Tax=Haptolina ericina TaxID=156174 RepID=A0A7S3B010_9EUKA
MQTAVDTSPLLAHRAAEVVPKRMLDMEAAYLARDFPAFAQLAMQDSNQFHATCLDTHPPIFYLNDVSRSVIQFVHAFNTACGEVRLGYTFDAGPNAVLLVLKQHTAQALAAVLHYFPPEVGSEASYVNREQMRVEAGRTGMPVGLADDFPMDPQPGTIKYVYHTDIGPGASVLPSAESLADSDGMPLKQA